MRKNITLILALSLMLALSACGTASAEFSEEIDTAPVFAANYEAIAADHDVEVVRARANDVRVCLHESHDELGNCVNCGMQVKHDYVAGVCACGRKLDIREDPIPHDWFNEQEQQGHVESICYAADLVASPGKTRNTYMSVYTPPQYDSSKKYNVLLFIDGDYSRDAGWLTAKEWVPGGYVRGKNMFDHIMGQNLVDPCIIVTTFQAHEIVGSTPEQLSFEIRNYVLPYVAENYSTYMADGSYEAQCAAREHLCIGGLSNYSMYMWRTGMMLCTDICANFISLSGTSNVINTVDHLHEEELAGNGIRFFFMSVGTYESRYSSDANSFHKLVEVCDSAVDGENAHFCPVNGQHEWIVWFTSAYNALQLIQW